jgi:hypothetical protein
MADKKFDFSGATQVCNEKPAVAPLPNNTPGKHPEWPNATYAPEGQLKASRDGTGNNWFGNKGKGVVDSSSDTDTPLPDGNSTKRERPMAVPKAWQG